jgi:hypothetical protein
MTQRPDNIVPINKSTGNNVADITALTGVTEPVAQPGSERYDPIADFGESLASGPTGNVIHNRRVGAAVGLTGILATGIVAGPSVAETVGNAASNTADALYEVVNPNDQPKKLDNNSPKVIVSSNGKVTAAVSPAEEAVARDKAVSPGVPEQSAVAAPTELQLPKSIPEEPLAFPEAHVVDVAVEPNDGKDALLERVSPDAYMRGSDEHREKMRSTVQGDLDPGDHRTVIDLDGPKLNG